jgi:hypothetical protein
VPVGWIAGIGGVVDDCDGFGVAVGVACEEAPTAACAPDGVAGDAVAGVIDTGGSGRVGGCDLSGFAVGVEEGAAFFGG